MVEGTLVESQWNEGELHRQVRELARVVGQLRRSIEDAERTLASLQEQQTTSFMDRAHWLGE